MLKRKSWAGTFGGSVMAPQSDATSLYVNGLQLGRNHRWPRRNVDRRRSFLCAANGRLALHATRSEDSSMRSRLSALAIILCGTLAIWLAMAPQQNFRISPVPPGADWTA